MFSFKNDLGIIPNEGTAYENDLNLAQGQQFMEYGRVYSSALKPHLHKIQLTSSPALQSITEALQGSDSILSANAASKSTISASEDEFNKTMTEYSQAFNEMNKELLAANNTKTQKKYFNTIVTTDDKNYTYVNNFGYTHKYSNAAWQKRDASCGVQTLKISETDLSELNKNTGAEMNIGQICQVAGHNIKNGKTNEVAWVDSQGYKHIYPMNTLSKKNNSCGNGPLKTLDSNSYDSIPTSSPMTETSNCNTASSSVNTINPDVIERLVRINKKLIKHAEKINKEMGNLNVNDDHLKMDITNQQEKVKKYIRNLKDDNKHFNAYKNSDSDMYNTLVGQDEVSGLTRRSNYFHYIIWMLLILTLILITLHSIINESYEGITVIIGLILLYIVTRYIYNWA